jgi:hypothetical protein
MTMEGSGSGLSERHRARRRQRKLAVIASLLWVIGFEVAPNLHVAMHDQLAPHRHGGDEVADSGGLKVKVTYTSGHQHADGSWHLDEVAAADPGGDDRLVRRGAGHGAHSLAHRGIAIHSPPPVITEPLPVTRTFAWLAIPADPAPRSPSAPIAVARGPPAA